MGREDNRAGLEAGSTPGAAEMKVWGNGGTDNESDGSDGQWGCGME